MRTSILATATLALFWLTPRAPKDQPQKDSEAGDAGPVPTGGGAEPPDLLRRQEAARATALRLESSLASPATRDAVSLTFAASMVRVLRALGLPDQAARLDRMRAREEARRSPGPIVISRQVPGIGDCATGQRRVAWYEPEAQGRPIWTDAAGFKYACV